MDAQPEPTFALAFAFDCNGRPLRGAKISFTRMKGGKRSTVNVPTDGSRFRPASVLFRQGIVDSDIEIRAEYANIESDPPVHHADLSKPFYCEFIFHLSNGEVDAEGGDRARKKKRFRWRCRCPNRQDTVPTRPRRNTVVESRKNVETANSNLENGIRELAERLDSQTYRNLRRIVQDKITRFTRIDAFDRELRTLRDRGLVLIPMGVGQMPREGGDLRTFVQATALGHELVRIMEDNEKN
jgi:hypothetical protein